MQRYFFHLHNDIDAPDTEGVVCADLDEARLLARRQARELIAASIMETGSFALSHHIDIADDSGAVAARVTFGAAVRIDD